MPIGFLFVGVMFIVLAYRGTIGDFEKLLVGTFTGAQSFVVWVSAILILGLLGFFKPIRPITDAFIGLIILVIILKNSGLFAQFNQALRSPVNTSPSSTATPTGFLGSALPDTLASSPQNTGGQSNFLGNALPDILSPQPQS